MIQDPEDRLNALLNQKPEERGGGWTALFMGAVLLVELNLNRTGFRTSAEAWAYARTKFCDFCKFQPIGEEDCDCYLEWIICPDEEAKSLNRDVQELQ